MPRPSLQLWRFDESEYDRTSQPYVCGKQIDGRACRIGPDADGRCLATYECLPRKDGAHHRCTRPESAGGKCAEGPSKDGVCAHAIEKCAPVRSWKSRRRGLSLGLAIAALVAGAGAFFWRGPVSNAIVSPGPVRPAHAAMGTDCGDCHGAATRGWIASALDPKPDGAKCLACHELDAHALAPHGIGGTGERALDCATCHPEHRGERVELARGGDATCRSCHPDASGSFAKDHPEFVSLGSGVARINFDHRARGHRAESCTSCHVLDGEGRRRVLAGFDSACSRCHLVDIAQSDRVAWQDPASFRRTDDPSWENDLRALACRVPLAPGATPVPIPADADPLTLPPQVPAEAIASRVWMTGGVLPASFAPGLPASGEWQFADGELSYRPLVHADPLMRARLDLVARHAGRKPRYKDDGGRCTLCHLLEPGENAKAISWTGYRDDSRLTRFSHAAHGEVACADCHVAGETTFAGVTKAACAGCHVKGKASDGCLVCHGYHGDRPAVPAPAGETITGTDACLRCHANAGEALAHSAHASSRLDTEERRASAVEIAGKLGVTDPATDARCTGCHATLGADGSIPLGRRSGSLALTLRSAPPRSSIAGVSCESCHGAARAWISVHADVSRADRLARSRSLGMIGKDDAFALADACLACHVVADPALVAAGHLSGSPMDAVLWSQGEVRHGFGDGCTGEETGWNREMPASRRRTLFVTGALLDVSRSLDALAQANGPGDYADAMKTRVTKAAKKLRKVADLESPLSAELTAVLGAIDALALDGDALPAAVALRAAAASARESAMRVSESRSPAAIEGIDDAIGAKIKGAPWAPG